jgi:hypothetical protein
VADIVVSTTIVGQEVHRIGLHDVFRVLRVRHESGLYSYNVTVIPDFEWN